MRTFEDNTVRLRSKLKDEREASILLSKLRVELSDAENYLLNTNASWREYFLNTEIYVTDPKEVINSDLSSLEISNKSFSKLVRPNLQNKVSNKIKEYLPIRIFTFDDEKYICNVYTLLWDVSTNKAKRKFLFNNTGDLFLEKESRNIYYKIFYNLRDDLYDIDISKYGSHYRLRKDGERIIKNCSNTKITHLVQSGSNIFDICKEYSDHDTYYNLYFDSYNKLDFLSIRMNLYKTVNGKRKANGYYVVEAGSNYLNTYYVNNKGEEFKIKKNSKDANNLFVSLKDEYVKTLGDYTENPNIDNYVVKYSLEKCAESLTSNKLGNTYMESELIDKCDSIDSVLSSFVGEIPFNTLSQMMKSDLKTSRFKSKGKKLIKK